MSGEAVVSWVLIGLAFVDWIATVILVRAARRIGEPALQERATVSVMLSIGASGAALLGAAYLLGWTFPSWLSFVLLAGGLLLLSVPQLLWAISYWFGRFR